VKETEFTCTRIKTLPLQGQTYFVLRTDSSDRHIAGAARPLLVLRHLFQQKQPLISLRKDPRLPSARRLPGWSEILCGPEYLCRPHARPFRSLAIVLEKMGGDGGVIASNRKYMRGAGAADHTGDHSAGNGRVDPEVLKEQQTRDFRSCAISGTPFDYASPIVACPYGRLYDKERALQGLLDKDEGLAHVRGLKDLIDVRFHTAADGGAPACPITEKELNGVIPTFVLIPGNANQPNVVSERGLSMKELLEDYGPVERTLRLLPPPEDLEKIKEARLSKVSEKKRKREKEKRKQKKAPRLDEP
jgi:Rtf2 RING-finger